jgi:hypothetical protein
LIDDFFEVNVDNPHKQWDRIWDLIPSRLPQRDKMLTSASPSILSILTMCRHFGEGNNSLCCFYSRVRRSHDTTTSDSFSAKHQIQHSWTRLLGMMAILVTVKIRLQAMMRLRKQGKMAARSGCGLYSPVIQFLLDKILDIYKKNVTKEDLSTYVSS